MDKTYLHVEEVHVFKEKQNYFILQSYVVSVSSLSEKKRSF